MALLRPTEPAPLLEESIFRLQGELVALGVSVTISDVPPAAEGDSAELRGWLERRSRERGIDAFIAVVEDDTLAANVWICERSPPRVELSRVVLAPTAGDRAAELAIHAIEVLRSRFVALDLAAGERPVAPKTRPADVAKPPTPPREDAARLGLEAGVTALTGASELGPALLPLVQADWRLERWASLQATAAGFGTRPRVETPSGSVAVARELALLGFCVCAPVRAGLDATFTLSGGVLHTTLGAEANAPNLGHRVERWSGLLDAGAGVRVDLPGRLYVSLAGHVELAAPYVAVHVLDAVVATTGRPNLLMTLTAGVRP